MDSDVIGSLPLSASGSDFDSGFDSAAADDEGRIWIRGNDCCCVASASGVAVAGHRRACSPFRDAYLQTSASFRSRGASGRTGQAGNRDTVRRACANNEQCGQHEQIAFTNPL